MTSPPQFERLARWWREQRRTRPGSRMFWAAVRRPAYAAAGVVLRRGIRVRLATRDVIRVHPAFLGWNLESYEPELMSWLSKVLAPDQTLFDVGAHVGFFSLLASRRVGLGGRIVAIEASPPTVGLLRRHVEMNRAKNVEIVPALASNEKGMREIVVRDSAIDPGACANSIAYRIPMGRAVCVRAVTLDGEAARINRAPRTIKIDVEGAELEVLRGATTLLRETRPLVACAVHPEPLQLLGSSAAELVQWMKGNGYLCCALDGQPISSPGDQNVLFLPEEQRSGVAGAATD